MKKALFIILMILNTAVVGYANTPCCNNKMNKCTKCAKSCASPNCLTNCGKGCKSTGDCAKTFK